MYRQADTERERERESERASERASASAGVFAWVIQGLRYACCLEVCLQLVMVLARYERRYVNTLRCTEKQQHDKLEGNDLEAACIAKPLSYCPPCTADGFSFKGVEVHSQLLQTSNLRNQTSPFGECHAELVVRREGGEFHTGCPSRARARADT